MDNLSVYYKLIDESVEKIDSVYAGSKENLSVKLSLPQALDQLKPRVIDAFKQNGFILSEAAVSPSSLNYSLTDAKVVYSDSYKDGFFGYIKTTRNVVLNGSYYISLPGGIEKPVFFNLVSSDTVAVDDIPTLENKSLPYTHGEVPLPPLFSNLIEPVIIIGALITTIILFFTVRSK